MKIKEELENALLFSAGLFMVLYVLGLVGILFEIFR